MLGEFDFQIIHRPGLRHQNADALSRRPCKQCGAEPVVEDLGLCAARCDELFSNNIVLASENTNDLADCLESELATETASDSELKVVVEWLKDASARPPWEIAMSSNPNVSAYWKQYDRLCVVDGVIYCEWFDLHGRHAWWQLVPPRSRRHEILTLAHGGRTGGHMGVRRTCVQVQRS